MGRNYLWYRRGEAANAVVGDIFRRVVRRLRLILYQILSALMQRFRPLQSESDVLHGQLINYSLKPAPTASSANIFTVSSE
jgi:IS5 family transposase